MDDYKQEQEEDKVYPHNNFNKESDLAGFFWRSSFWDENPLKIHKMSLKEAVEKGICTVTCPDGILEAIKAHNVLLEATRASPMTDEEIEQIRFFARSIDRCCSDYLAFSGPIRTPDPTEEEISQWREDYAKFQVMDIDALYTKYGIKLELCNEGCVAQVWIDPRNHLQNDKFIDPFDCNARKKAYEKAQESFGWQRNYDETSVWHR